MIVVLVHVHVRPESVEEFRAATIENARCSHREPGVARFDVLQKSDDPCRWVLVEAYRTAEAQAQHKQTEHYARWRDRVAPMMAEPRGGPAYASVFPDDSGW